MSEDKYDNDKTVCSCDKFQFLLDDYEYTHKELEQTKRRLEELEDAIMLSSYECSKGDLYYTFENVSRSDNDFPKYHKPIRQAIANSRARKQG